MMERSNGTRKRNPYAILNLSTNANQDDIQRAYKYGSRYFHPDKIQQQQQQTIITATANHSKCGGIDIITQEIFIELKNAFDILSDPITKLIFDKYGFDGIGILKNNTKNDYENIYKKLNLLYNNGYVQEAENLLDTIILEHNYKVYSENNPSINGNMTMECTMIDSNIIPQNEKTDLSVNIDMPLHNNNNIKFIKIGCNSSISSYLNTGKSTTNIVLGIDPIPYTSMTFGVNVDNNSTMLKNIPTPTFSSTRMLYDGTPIIINTQLSIMKNEDDDQQQQQQQSNNSTIIAPDIQIFSHRVIFQKILADIGLGFGIDNKHTHFHFFRLSATSMFPKNLPQLKFQVNAGVYHLPVSISIKQNLSYITEDNTDNNDDDSTINFSMHTNFVNKISFDACIKRKYSNNIIITKIPSYIQLGVRHTHTGNAQLVIKLSRMNTVFSIPITLFTRNTTQYMFKLSYLAFMTFLLDQSIQDIIQSINNNNHIIKIIKQEKQQEEDRKSQKQKHDNHTMNTLLQTTKTKSLSNEQMRLMTNIAHKKQLVEKNNNGLIILYATYYAINKQTYKEINSLDVTIPVQFYVTNSTLYLPIGAKSNIMGFYNIINEKIYQQQKKQTMNEISFFSWAYYLWNKFKGSGKDNNELYSVFLKIRYAHNGIVYEMNKHEEEEIHLPFCNDNDTLLLGKNIT